MNRKPLGGPLYPPIHAFLYAPLAVGNSPQAGYLAFQWVSLAAVFLAGLGVSVLSRGRVWWPVATAGFLLYPGCLAGLELGQNAILTLAIVVWGWALASRGRDGWGGVGLGPARVQAGVGGGVLRRPALSGPVAVLRGDAARPRPDWRRRRCPFVGVQGWLDWLAVGQEGSALYLVNRNWIELSRDLFGLPRRVLIDFTRARRPSAAVRFAAAIGWSLWGAVFVATFAVTSAKARSPARPAWRPASSLSGRTSAATGSCITTPCCRTSAWRSCFAEWESLVPLSGRSGWRGLVDRWANAARSVPVVIVAPPVRAGKLPRPSGVRGRRTGFSRRTIGTGYRYPWDTLLILILWAWAGWKLLRQHRASEP